MPQELKTDAAVPELVIITLGGSHRALKVALRALEQAGIPQRWLGPVTLNAKRHKYTIPARCLADALRLNIGASKSREQWEWLDQVTEQDYFRIERSPE